MHGTHQGEFRGIAPTGKRITVTGIGIFRFSDEGKVVESWDNFDQLGMMRQLGPSPASADVYRVPISRSVDGGESHPERACGLALVHATALTIIIAAMAAATVASKMARLTLCHLFFSTPPAGCTTKEADP
jgi:hypothetical protein